MIVSPKIVLACLQEKHVTATPQRALLWYQKSELMTSLHIINFIPLNTRWAKVNLEKAGLKFNTPQIKKSIFKKEKW
jgi:hypothetical protein